MSEVILRQADKLREVKLRIEEFIREVLEESASIIEDLIIAQLQEGTDGDGNTLPDYSPTSVFVYGKPPGPIKLFDQGDFYRGVFLELFDNAFDIDDKDSKTAKLVREYGPAILKLNEKNKQWVIDSVLKPGLTQKVYNFITQ